MKRRRCIGGAAAGVLALAGIWAAASTPAAPAAPVRPAPARAEAQGTPGAVAAGRPALWRTYDMIVNLQDLPRTYTCNQLWSEFHDIVLQLGAWPYTVNVLPYNCSPTPSGDLKSPNVEVRFQLPIFLQGVAAKTPPAEAIEGTVRLAPGEPKILQTSDCQLLQQIDHTLLASIDAHVQREHFDCSASPRRAGNFDVVLSLPMGVKMPAVAATSAAAPH